MCWRPVVRFLPQSHASVVSPNVEKRTGCGGVFDMINGEAMIPRIQKILFATDLSRNSAYAFRYAVNSARKHDASIHILHVVDSRPVAESYLLIHADAARMSEIRQETKEELVAAIEARVKEFVRRELRDDPETLKRVASIQVLFGDPAEKILKVAATMKCDIVVMGTHGKGVISHAFLGSVAEKVLHRIGIPVYIIPIPTEDEDTEIISGEILPAVNFATQIFPGSKS